MVLASAALLIAIGETVEIRAAASPAAALDGAAAVSERVLSRFAGAPDDGDGPGAALVADKWGNLYGTTTAGGANSCPQFTFGPGCGTVFELGLPLGGAIRTGKSWDFDLINGVLLDAFDALEHRCCAFAAADTRTESCSNVWDRQSHDGEKFAGYSTFRWRSTDLRRNRHEIPHADFFRTGRALYNPSTSMPPSEPLLGLVVSGRQFPGRRRFEERRPAGMAEGGEQQMGTPHLRCS